MGLDSITLYDFNQKTEIPKLYAMVDLWEKNLPSSSILGEVNVSDKTRTIRFYLEQDNRVPKFNVSNFKDNTLLTGKIILSNMPCESMVIATLFEKDKYFYYNQKINCMRAEGVIMFGVRNFVFEPSNSFGV